jgi:hypothetical protein
VARKPATARKTPLRAVEDGEKPKRTRPKTLVEAIESGDYLEILLAQQRDIAAALPEAAGPAKAALHRQFSLVSKDIETLRAADTDGDEVGKAAATPDDKWDADAI